MTALQATLAELRECAADNSSMGLLERETVELWQYITRLQDAVLAASDIVNGEGDHHDNAEAVEEAAAAVRELEQS
jgi:hypothetical protein